MKVPGLHADGGGLYLQVTLGANGAVNAPGSCASTHHGRRREMGLGPIALVDLADARDAALAARKQARAGVDPIAARNSARAEAKVAKV